MPILNDVDLESTFYYFSWQPFGWMFEPTLMLPEESRLFCKADEDGFTDTLSLGKGLIVVKQANSAHNHTSTVRRMSLISSAMAILTLITGLFPSFLPLRAFEPDFKSMSCDPEVLAIPLVRSFFVMVFQANQTNNFNVMRDLGTTSFRESNTLSDLEDIFSTFQFDEEVLSEILCEDPIIIAAEIRERGTQFRVEGVVATDKLRIEFHLSFQRSNRNRWAIEEIWIGFQSARLAPERLMKNADDENATPISPEIVIEPGIRSLRLQGKKNGHPDIVPSGYQSHHTSARPVVIPISRSIVLRKPL